MRNTKSFSGKRLDQYQVHQLHASGGMADVYRATDTLTDQKLCLKVMQARMKGLPEIKKRFWREGAVIKKLRHPHIVRVYDVGLTEDDRPYLVMEFIEGGNLDQLMKELLREGVYPSARWILQTMRQIVEALAVLHRENIVHRDLKPENILMRSRDEAVLADMGIMSVQTATRLTVTKSLLGTPLYMSPEQVESGVNIDGRSDIYAVGVILYELFANQRPFSGNDRMEIMRKQVQEEPIPLAQRRADLKPETIQLVNTCMRKDPDARYQNCRELLRAIDRAIAAEAGKRPGLALSLGARWPYAALAVAALLLLAGGITFWQPEDNDETSSVPTRVPVIVVATATETAVMPTDAPPTNTPLPSPTATATATATPTHTPPPSPTATSTPRPSPSSADADTASTQTAACLPSPGPRWGDNLYAQYGDRLGCALTEVSEPFATFQQFQKGLMILLEDRARAYVLPYDASYAVFNVSDAPEEYPSDYDDLVGPMGWLWNTNADIQAQLDTPDSPVFRASDFAIQEFEGGFILYFLENNANHYILIKNDRSWFTPFE